MSEFGRLAFKKGYLSLGLQCSAGEPQQALGRDAGGRAALVADSRTEACAAAGEGGRGGHGERRTQGHQLVEQTRVMVPTSFFTKEGSFPSFQSSRNIFVVI